MVSIGHSGDVHAVVDVSFGAPRREVTLQVPERIGSGAVFHPTVEILRVEAGGRQQVPTKTLGVGEETSIHLDHAADHLLLEYAGAGTYVASGPAPPGRGLVLLTPLIVLESDIPSQLGATDPRILNLACGRSGQMRACGSRTGDGWTADRVGSDEDVVAQVDLLSSGS